MAVIATRLHSTESKLRFYAGWNSAFCAPEFCDTEKNWQYALLESLDPLYHKQTGFLMDLALKNCSKIMTDIFGICLSKSICLRI